MSSPVLAAGPHQPVGRYDYAQQFGAIDELLNDLRRMLLGGHYILTSEVAAFESAFARYCGCEYARGVNTGTDALVIALRALGVGPGDRVMTQANTFHATVAAIELAGARPVLTDVHPETWLMNPPEVAARLTSDIRVLLPVHLFGKPSDMGGLSYVAAKSGTVLVEDAAQAHGARIFGRPVGSFGAAGCFSFHPSKNLAAAGDGGAIVTQDAAVAQRIDMLRSLGQRSQNEHIVVGWNSKLDAIQARILSWKLERLDRSNASRNQIASRYRAELAGLPVSFQAESPDELHVYHLFQLRTSERDALLAHLRACAIDAVIRYPTPIHLQEAFAHWNWQRGDFPVAERLAAELLCLPIRPEMSEDEISCVIDAVRGFYRNHTSQRRSP